MADDAAMALGTRATRLSLIVHVVSSVGWLGAVAAFLALALTALASPDPEMVRSSSRAMDVVARTVIVPLSLAALASGVVQSLSTEWGLVRHHWVLAKFVLTVLAVGFLLLHLRPIRLLAEAAAAGPLAGNDLRRLRIQIAADAAAGLVVLLVNTILSVLKPRGLTRYGRRRLSVPRTAGP